MGAPLDYDRYIARRAGIGSQVFRGRLDAVILRLELLVLGLELAIVLFELLDSRAECRELAQDLVNRRRLLRERWCGEHSRHGARDEELFIHEPISSVLNLSRARADGATQRAALWLPTVTLLFQEAADSTAGAARTGCVPQAQTSCREMCSESRATAFLARDFESATVPLQPVLDDRQAES